ncbi:sulfite exporter TauE/SafE family protein [Thermoplasma sp. Kam2015]|uniref:sulfite exporter TauE/SafE family protein n=1 Tax=Thermoplasma sp. Kam2015 TaxID=2094122 RepID=UPI000D9399CD|nr:sulfite exporter TauE/SafE family protein [Thermoplasma sp. Kam2015]PYB68043.1 sulfite exporter TauE/SafE family protein [Thermoplasma sp. Kam2015]
MPLLLLLILIGISVGALTGITGSSGVLIVVPALSLMGLTFQDSVGTSLLVDVITTSTVIYVYFRNKNIDIAPALIMGLGALLGTQIGIRIAISVSETPLEIAFSILTMALAVQMFRRARGHGINIKEKNADNTRSHFFLAFLLSIPVGVLTGTLGTSGGIMFIGILMLLFSLSAQKMVGTATLAMIFSALSGSAGYIIVGRISLLDAAIIGSISLISGYFFSTTANKIRESLVYEAIGSIFVIVVIVEIMKITGFV